YWRRPALADRQIPPPDDESGATFQEARMPRAERLDRIRRLEVELRSPVVAYVTSTRTGAEAQMAMDAIRFLYEHLVAIQPRPEAISLFLHSNGGDGIVPWKLVTLVREYCDRFRVLVPYRAFSAATLTALGADEIYMHPMGMLGPTDPSIIGPYNPRDQDGKPLPISVEEVLAYLALVKEDAGIQHEDELVQAVGKLADNVHPIALGSVKRSHAQSRMIAAKLMELNGAKLDEHRIDEIVSNLTSKLYYHGHPINRKEAKQIGLNIVECSRGVEEAIWSLFETYEQDMDLLTTWDPAQQFIRLAPDIEPGQSRTVKVPKLHMALIESRNRCDMCTTDVVLFGQKDAKGSVQAQPYVYRSSWETESTVLAQLDADADPTSEADGPRESKEVLSAPVE
ncbi:MAG: SDH family Clp fold serine proteinase, partial [Longimicrobiales bacterium]